MSLESVRAVADAVLYEGYLLYPYRASAPKNRSRWQFGVLGPPRAAEAAFAESPGMSMQCLLVTGLTGGSLTVHLRFLQLQTRRLLDADARPADSLGTMRSWDEAVEREITLPGVTLARDASFGITIPGGEDVEAIAGGTVVRGRRALTARLATRVETVGELTRLTVAVTNEHPGPADTKQDALEHSLIATHLVVEAHDAAFLPPQEELADCRQDRCWPVLAGPPGTTNLLLAAPIILYDHPRLAERSPGDLFDATEIDELLTLRVMTLTDGEKAEARATDARAAAIVDRCDAISPEELLGLHGTRLPGEPSVLVDGVRIAAGSLVRLRPTRRADAQDLFFAGQAARVTAVLDDVDGGIHVAVVLVDDPAADLHDGYGRYLYFAPDELDPLPVHRPEEEDHP
ncbi:hypothetical protein [Actinoplanes sp. NPDC051851]|uniref:hypothetical protein n=1 Tax=Actinoplanes sp. NPDC051851 TaxID=3154753 RepID=UPI00342CF3F2